MPLIISARYVFLTEVSFLSYALFLVCLLTLNDARV